MMEWFDNFRIFFLNISTPDEMRFKGVQENSAPAPPGELVPPGDPAPPGDDDDCRPPGNQYFDSWFQFSFLIFSGED